MKYLLLLAFLISCEDNDFLGLDTAKCINGVTYLKAGKNYYKQPDYNECVSPEEIKKITNHY